MKVSKKVIGVEYAIRDIVTAARRVERTGKKVEYLNIGDPLQFGFTPPQNVKDALKRAQELLDDTDCIIEITPKNSCEWSY